MGFLPCIANRPTIIGWNPSTSFSMVTAPKIASSLMCCTVTESDNMTKTEKQEASTQALQPGIWLPLDLRCTEESSLKTFSSPFLGLIEVQLRNTERFVAHLEHDGYEPKRVQSFGRGSCTCIPWTAGLSLDKVQYFILGCVVGQLDTKGIKTNFLTSFLLDLYIGFWVFASANQDHSQPWSFPNRFFHLGDSNFLLELSGNCFAINDSCSVLCSRPWKYRKKKQYSGASPLV